MLLVDSSHLSYWSTTSLPMCCGGYQSAGHEVSTRSKKNKQIQCELRARLFNGVDYTTTFAGSWRRFSAMLTAYRYIGHRSPTKHEPPSASWRFLGLLPQTAAQNERTSSTNSVGCVSSNAVIDTDPETKNKREKLTHHVSCS